MITRYLVQRGNPHELVPNPPLESRRLRPGTLLSEPRLTQVAQGRPWVRKLIPIQEGRHLVFQLFPRLSATVCLLFVVGAASAACAQTQNQAPSAARSRSAETLELWNMIGNKLIAMAQDFPEDKYDFKIQKDQRTFAENLLHAAAFEYLMARKLSGSKNLGPDFGEGDNPSREKFKTKADVVQFVQGAVAAGAKVIQEQGDAGLDKTTSWGKQMVHHSYVWTFAVEHSAEHYGQLVGYYRANNLVPPDSRH